MVARMLVALLMVVLPVARGTDAEPPGAARTGQTFARPVTVSTRPVSVPPAGMPSPHSLYRSAVEAFLEGKYDLATQGFHMYVTRFPGTLREARSHFWLAETSYAQGAFLEAIRRYDVVIAHYPDSAKVPAAYLKKAYAYMEIGEVRVAVTTLRELRARFPKTREARLAGPALLDVEGPSTAWSHPDHP